MKLPRGVTSFGVFLDDAEDALRNLKTIAHHAARRTYATVAEVVPAGVTPNFHTVVLAWEDRRIAILRHNTLPMLAFARPRDYPSYNVVFVDDDQLAVVVREVSDLPIMTTPELGPPLSRADLTDLDPSEHEQIAYWRPGTVGEVLFNYWD